MVMYGLKREGRPTERALVAAVSHLTRGVVWVCLQVQVATAREAVGVCSMMVAGLCVCHRRAES